MQRAIPNRAAHARWRAWLARAGVLQQRRSDARFRAVAQSANDAIISIDSQGAIVSWNHGAQRMFGYREDEVRGRPLTLIIPDRFRAPHQQGVARMTATGESHVIGHTVELHGQRRNGSEFPLELSLATWLLRRYEVAPDRVTLEITESALMADPEQARAALACLTELGVRLAIDDFGTGYSSLAYLKHLPVDAVKIDKGFVQSMGMTTTKDNAIVSSILQR